MDDVGFLDALLGRKKPVRPDLDRLFALPSAAVTLQAGAGLAPTGLGSVCFATVEGGAFTQLRRDVRALLDADTERGGVPVEFGQDEYGYTWLLARHAPEDLPTLVNDLHAVNTLLVEGGFGSQLLCSLIGFREAPETLEASETLHAPESLETARATGAIGATGSAEATGTPGTSKAAGEPSEAGAGGAPGPAPPAGARPLALVYLYKQGTFYPFAPRGQEKRDSALELRVRGLLAGDLPVEQDLSRWFPVWGAPGL